MTGRRIGGAPPATPEEGEPERKAASPFAAYTPDVRTMEAGAAENRSQSMGVLAIVGGVLFTAIAGLVIGLMVVFLWLLVRQVQGPADVADGGGNKDQHVHDTGHIGPIENVQIPGKFPGKRKDNGPVVDPNAPPPPGPASVIVDQSMMFLSIEINCGTNFRERGTFRKESATTMKATVQNVSATERCIVTFQGSEPAKTWISGNQTKKCTFNPVTCHLY